MSGSLSNNNELRSVRASASAKEAPRVRLEVCHQILFLNFRTVTTVHNVMVFCTGKSLIGVPPHACSVVM